jgi:hypothetical protein
MIYIFWTIILAIGAAAIYWLIDYKDEQGDE